MPYAKEEIAKLLKENYEKLQISELSVYDTFKGLRNDLDKYFTKIEAHLDNALQVHKKTLKDAESLRKKHDKAKASAIKSKNDQLDIFVKDIEEQHKKKVEILQEEMHQFSIENEAKALKENEIYTTSVAELEKALEVFEQKESALSKDLKLEKSEYIKLYASKKDELESTHKKLLKDLEERHNKNTVLINEKSNKAIEKLTVKVEDLKAKQEKKLQTAMLAYEKELSDIENKIAADETEVNSRRENIVKAAEKRIQVREKHIDRAENDNDKRSLKQHQKDIKKISRDRDRDLRILDDEIVIVVNKNKQFRSNFVEENLRDITKLKESQKKAIFELEEKIALEEAQLEKDLFVSKKDYEKEFARKENEYKVSLYDLNIHEQQIVEELDLKLTQNNNDLQILDTSTKYDLDVLKSNLEDTLNELETALAERQQVHERDINLANVWMQIEKSKIESERQTEGERYDYDLFMEDIRFQEAELQYLISEQTSRKDNFLLYEEQFKPVVIEKAEALYEYEKLEIETRTAKKIAFLEAEKLDLKTYYDSLQEKIKAVYEQEVKPFNEVIQSFLIPLNETLNNLKVNFDEQVDALDAAINQSKNRKEKRELELNLEEVNSLYQKNKLDAEINFNERVQMYKQYLDDALVRKVKALDEAANVYQMQLDRLTEAIDNTHNLKAEINKESEQRMQTLMQGVHAFNQHSEKRDVVQAKSLEKFNNDKLGFIQSKVDDRTASLNQTIIMVEQALQKSFNNFADEENRLRKQCDFEVSEIERKRSVKLSQLEQMLTQKNVMNKTKLDQLEKQFRQQSNKIKSDVSLTIEKLTNNFNTDKELFENVIRDTDNQKSKDSKRFESLKDSIGRNKDSKIAMMEKELRIELRDMIDKI